MSSTADLTLDFYVPTLSETFTMNLGDYVRWLNDKQDALYREYYIVDEDGGIISCA